MIRSGQLEVSGYATSFQQNRRQPFQFFIARVDLKSARFQSRNAEQGFGAGIPIYDRTTHDFTFNLEFRDCYVHGNGFAVRKYGFADAPRCEPDRIETIS